MRVPAGTVLSLHRYPVKSLGGEQLAAAELDGHGFAADRTHRLVDGRGKKVTALTRPRLLLWRAAAGTDGAATVTAPDGRTFTTDDAALESALSAEVGRDVRLQPGRHQDVEDSVLITVEASRGAAEASLDHPLDLRRFRPNLHLQLDAEPYAEASWTGRRLRAGDAELEILEACDRCAIPTWDPDTVAGWPDLLRWINAELGTFFGIRARAVHGGVATIREGDAVELL